MKKLFLSLVAALMAATATYAQSTLVATLSHGSDIKMFYGTYALRDAHSAAVSGDVINLSGGSFQAITITKAVTIRGAGFENDIPTKITNEININIPDTDTNRLTIEGLRSDYSIRVHGTLNNPLFTKCWFNVFDANDYTPTISNAIFMDCLISGSTTWGSNYNSVQYINSSIWSFRNISGDRTKAMFMNCIIIPHANYGGYLSGSQLTNCIISTTNGEDGGILSESSIATNCINIDPQNRKRFFKNTQTNTNCNYATFAEVFKFFTGNWQYNNRDDYFELTDEAKSRYLGTDGTEVGMYGGVMPYNSIPSYPRITKMNVANKTTADGKLSVDIEVSAAQ